MNQAPDLLGFQIACELAHQSFREAELQVCRGESCQPPILAIFPQFPDFLSLDVLRDRVAEWRSLEASDSVTHHFRILLAYLLELIVLRARSLTYGEIFKSQSAFQLEFGEWKLAFLQSEREIEREGDRERREEIEHQRLAGLESWQNLHQDLFQSLQDTAVDLGFDHYWDMWCALHALNPDTLAAGIETVLHETEDLYFDARGWFVRKRLGSTRREPCRHDILHLFYQPSWDRHFPPELPPRIPLDLLDGLAVPPRDREKMIIEETSSTSSPAGSRCVPVEIPASVYFLVKPVAGAEAARQALGQAGLMLYYAHVNPELPFSVRGLGDQAIPLVYSALLEGLTVDEAWLHRVLGWSRPDEWRLHQQFRRLFIFRRYCGLALYLKALWGSQDPAECREQYREAMHEAVGVDYPDAYYLADADTMFGPLSAVRSALMACQLSRHLVQTLEADWFRHPGAYEVLRQVWSLGTSQPLTQMAAHWGGEEWDATPLVEQVAEVLA